MITDGTVKCGLCGEFKTGCGLCGNAPLIPNKMESLQDSLEADKELWFQEKYIKDTSEKKRAFNI